MSTRYLWDVAVLLKEHGKMREDARKWADELGRLKELDSWLNDPRL